jgi:hypothetical protein
MRMSYARDLIVGLCIFIILESILLIGLSSLRCFHRDEVNWIRVSIYSFRTFFIDRDFFNEGWSKSFRSWGSYNPQVGKFIIGASLWLHRYRDFEGVVHFEEYKHEDLEYLIEQGMGIVPPPEELYAARLPIAILAAGTASLVFALATFAQRSALRGKGLLGGVLASLFFFFHPLIQSFGRRAMLDIPALFFSTLAMALAVMSGLAFIRRLRKRGLLLGIGTAIAVGLAISTKMNAVLIWPVVFLGAMGIASRHFERHGRASIRFLFVYAALLLGVPVAVFVLSNPFLYRDPVSGTLHMLRLSKRVASYRPGFPDKALFTIIEKLEAFADLGFGPLERLFHREAIDILIVGIGIVVMGYVLLRGQQKMEATFIGAMLLWWTTVIGVGITLWTPLAWDRYYVPWTPIASVWEGVGVAWLLTALLKVFESVLHKSRPWFSKLIVSTVLSRNGKSGRN